MQRVKTTDDALPGDITCMISCCSTTGFDKKRRHLAIQPVYLSSHRGRCSLVEDKKKTGGGGVRQKSGKMRMILDRKYILRIRFCPAQKK